jgi:hypothetical protein
MKLLIITIASITLMNCSTEIFHDNEPEKKPVRYSEKPLIEEVKKK